jgi:hypothetical protein
VLKVLDERLGERELRPEDADGLARREHICQAKTVAEGRRDPVALLEASAYPVPVFGPPGQEAAEVRGRDEVLLLLQQAPAAPAPGA